MLCKVLNELRSTDFDFRVYADPSDPDKGLFNDRVDYYKLKWALSKVIQPKSICEIGVGYGYSAIAFLDAAPEAHYIGINIDSGSHMDQIDVIHWPKNITRNYQADFITSDYQDIAIFPEGEYDLVHINRPQDFDRTYYELEKALLHGRYILVDSFYGTNENFQSSSAFLRDNQNLIDYYFVIPGFTGQLLIKVNEKNASAHRNTNSDKVSLSIQEHYASNYYLQDCGGFAHYKLYHGKKLADPRLNAVFNIANVKQEHHIIDAGCGRGELTYACAMAGATVDAVDYSSTAITLAKECFSNEPTLIKNVNFHCGDITKFKASNKVDRVIASDLIEHLAFHELDQLYENLARDLKNDGQFIIHTFPNLWFYQYGYSQRRRKAKAMGAYLSPEPRTYYERLMHINEQSPRVLKKQLSKYFKNVLVWFGTPDNSLGSLVKSYSHTDCKFSSDLFAIASHSPINVESIVSRLTQKPLNVEERLNITIGVAESCFELAVGEVAYIDVKVVNNNHFPVQSLAPNPVHISYHWVKNDETIVFNGRRTPFSEVLNGGESIMESMLIEAPESKGKYKLQIGLVQEYVAWFEQDDCHHLITLSVDVV